MDIDRIRRRVLYNCDVTDAHHAGIYSVCGLVMRLRDLYKWERRLSPWREDAPADVLEWIGEKESLWEGLMANDYRPLPINGLDLEAFDTRGVNEHIQSDGYFYGAGYAHGMKPTFLLAEIEDRVKVDHRDVLILGREYARDLLTLPAFSQDGQVVLRMEAGRMYLWDQILYMSNSGRKGLHFALDACGLEDHQQETIVRHFDDLWQVQQSIYIRHEVGEMEDRIFNRDIWRCMLADYPHTAVELYVRTLKDLLADTDPHGTLAHLINHRDSSALGLYMAFGNGITRILSRELICAFDAFTSDPNWRRIADASQTVRSEVKDRTHQVVELYRQGQNRKDKESAKLAIEEMMRQASLIK